LRLVRNASSLSWQPCPQVFSCDDQLNFSSLTFQHLFLLSVSTSWGSYIRYFPNFFESAKDIHFQILFYTGANYLW
jgi:hypothetical protein